MKRRLEDLVQVLDPKGDLWYGGRKPLEAVADLTAEQAAWVPSEGRPSIWGLVLHIAYWKYDVRRHLVGPDIEPFPRSPDDWPQPSATTAEQWQADRELLRHEHEALVDVVRSLEPADLDQPKGSGRYTVYDLILGIVMHDTYHTGQIQQLVGLMRDAGESSAGESL